MRPVLVTTSEAAVALGIPANTISSWRRRGRIQPISWHRGRGRGGRVPVYDLEQLRQLHEGCSRTRPLGRMNA